MYHLQSLDAMAEESAGLPSVTVISNGRDCLNQDPQYSELTASVKSSEDAVWLRDQVKVARDEINKLRCKNNSASSTNV